MNRGRGEGKSEEQQGVIGMSSFLRVLRQRQTFTMRSGGCRGLNRKNEEEGEKKEIIIAFNDFESWLTDNRVVQLNLIVVVVVGFVRREKLLSRPIPSGLGLFAFHGNFQTEAKRSVTRMFSSITRSLRLDYRETTCIQVCSSRDTSRSDTRTRFLRRADSTIDRATWPLSYR